VRIPTICPRLPFAYVGFAKETIINFEIKSSIPSIGELIRQIRMYQTYQKGRYVVVSPDARWERMLDSQRIGFIACPE
jgi:hypothetical protein